MLLTKRELPVLAVNVIYITVFTLIALRRTNYEFLLYVGVIVIIAVWILFKQRAVQFDATILWGLTAWGLMHMAGGNLQVRDGVLYGVVILPLVPSLEILRYDQFVHAFGFGVATLVCHHILKPYLKDEIARWRGLAALVALMGLGVGALNEIIEFVAVLTMPETGVGGYDNTMWDLVFDMLGAAIAVIWIGARRRVRLLSAPVLNT